MTGFGDPTTQAAFSIHENQGVFALILGSGISRAAEIPTGWEITLDLVRRVAEAEGAEEQADWAKWYIEKEGKEPDYSDLLAKLATTQAERRAILHSYIEPNDEDREEGRKLPTKAHKAIAGLVRSGHVRVIVTTNFDRLIENALREEGIEPTVVSSVDTLKGAEPLSHSACYVFKVHGDYKDTRILNTEEELEGYPEEFDRLLDRIFDEYGLIICGWSGEWDQALRSAVTRAPSRRYPLFWASRGDLKGKAKDLSDLRGGITVPINDADTFFVDLSERVRTLEQSRRRNPVGIDMLVSRAKRYLSKSEHRIQFSDLLNDEVSRIIEVLESDEMAPGTQWSVEEFNRRVNEYESVSEGLVKICGLTGVWGDSNFLGYATDAIKTFWEVSQTQMGGNIAYLNLRGYVSVLAYQAMGLALVQSARWKELRELLDANIWAERNEDATILHDLIPARWVGNEKTLWRNLPGFELRHAPLADHLHAYFEQHSKAFLGGKRDITQTYLLSEVLPAIASLDHYALDNLEEKLQEEYGRGYFWAPVAGRMGWNHWAMKRLYEKFENGKLAVEVASGGFGRGDSKIVLACLNHVKRSVSNLHWH
ncbi:SIR2 family protein [Roseovarius mucosus]|uniref:SIR2 family protein n=1 Tax=Roseovarius mucosus TaxID=215743 RepID=UPI0035CF5A2C